MVKFNFKKKRSPGSFELSDCFIFMLICILGFVKAMEDHKDEVILILAGYHSEMDDFLKTNPGLRSRFPIHIDFPDYSRHELLQIAELMCSKREYRLNGEARGSLLKIFDRREKSGECFGNARTVRNIIEKAIRRQAVRLMAKSAVTREELINLEACDIYTNSDLN